MMKSLKPRLTTFAAMAAMFTASASCFADIYYYAATFNGPTTTFEVPHFDASLGSLNSVELSVTALIPYSLVTGASGTIIPHVTTWTGPVVEVSNPNLGNQLLLGGGRAFEPLFGSSTWTYYAPNAFTNPAASLTFTSVNTTITSIDHLAFISIQQVGSFDVSARYDFTPIPETSSLLLLGSVWGIVAAFRVWRPRRATVQSA
jgi:hypothetical protein